MLTQKQIDNLTDYVRQGQPTLLLLDPLPSVNPSLAPEVPSMPPGGLFGGGPPPEPKGDLEPLLDLLGRRLAATEIVWNPYNPLSRSPDLPPEFVFVGKGSGRSDAFNPAEPASSGLQEWSLLFPGLLRPRRSEPEFTPLLQTATSGGTLAVLRGRPAELHGHLGPQPEPPHVASDLRLHPRRPDPGQAAGDPDPNETPKKDAEAAGRASTRS